MSDQAAGSTVDITVPDLSGAENVEIIEILISEGDQVVIDDSLVTLESDKASMEIPAEVAGTVRSITVAVGDTVSTGDRIGVIELPSGAATSTKSATVASDSTEIQQPRDNSHTTAPADLKSVAMSKSAATDSSPAPSSFSNNSRQRSPTATIDDESMRKAHASPSVRRYAREHGADLSLISGTGRKDRIVKEDVTAFIKRALDGIGSNYGAPGSGAPGMGIPAIPEIDFSKFGEIERVELGRINKLSATNLHRAWLNVPMVTHHDEADITDMDEFRKQLKQEVQDGEPKVTGLAFHMKALVFSLKSFPKLNASLTPDGQSIVYKHYYHIGIAVDTPAGLVVPVFRDVDKKNITELAAEMADVSNRARSKKLKPAEMQGASMTISSLGGIGGSAFTPIVNAPEVAILGITRARLQPVWDGQQFLPRLMCPLDLTYDHRAVDGAEAARFLAHYCRSIGDVRRLLL